jgi:adenylate kinase family enzyme
VSLTIITGPPGAGKTTVAGAVARSRSLGVHLVADQCFHWIASGYVAPWLPAANHQNGIVIDAIGAASGRYAEGGYDVVVDGIVGPWFLWRFQQAAGPSGLTLQYVVLRPTREVALGRALGRRSAGSLVDPGPAGAMYDVFEDLGLFELHVVDSSQQESAATAADVRRRLDAGQFALSERHRDDMAQLARRYNLQLPDDRL